MAQDNRSEQNLKLDIFVVNVTNPFKFQFYRASSKLCEPKKLNGSMIDISPADSVYDPMHLLNNVIALEWTKDAIEIFKNLVTARELAFEIKNKKNNTFYGKLYLKLSHGERDVSEIMVEMGKAYDSTNQLTNTIDPFEKEYAKAFPDVQQTENKMLEISVPEENSMSEVDSSSLSSLTLISCNTIEKLETFASDSSDDSDWKSMLMSVCSDDSGKTEEIGEAAPLVPMNHNPNQSDGISLSDNIDTIPAYLLEDDISEIGAEKYSVPRNGFFLGEMEVNNETNAMRKLLKNAKRLDSTFKLLFAPMEQRERLMFHRHVNDHFKWIREHKINHIQERMWSIISKGTANNIHIVGDTHYIMYLPPICDSIYPFQLQRYNENFPWKGPEALIVVSDTKEAKEIHEFCSIILKTNAVYLDLNTPSDKLSIKDAGIRKCAILIVRLNRLANLMAMGDFNYCKYIVIDGVHRLWAHERHSLAEWLKRKREKLPRILTSKHYVEVFERSSALLAIQSYMDGVVIAGMQLTLHPSTEFDLFNVIGQCAVVSTNDKNKKDLSDRLRKFLPKATFDCISFYTDKEIQHDKKFNFKVLVHNGLPESFEIFEQRFAISVGILERCFQINKETNKFVKSFILMNSEEVTLTTKQKQILEMLRDRNILPNPCPKQSLVQKLGIRFRTKIMKIEVVSVLTPEQYQIRCESNTESIVRLSDISPKLKFGWDSMDLFRVKCLLLSHPFSDKQIEAYVYIDGEQILVDDMLIHESGKTICLKKWLREQEIIR